MALRVTITNMHFQLCPLRELQDDDAFTDNSDCDDCALIAAAYSQGYEEGWVDAGEQAMNTITDRMAQAASEMYDVLLMEEIPAEKFGKVQVFR